MRFSHGFTLIEMLVALAITMMMMGAVVSLFGTDHRQRLGQPVDHRNVRTAAAQRRNRLQADLQGITATMTPPLRPEERRRVF